MSIKLINKGKDKKLANKGEKTSKKELINQKLISIKLANKGEIKELVNKNKIKELANKKLAKQDKARQTQKPQDNWIFNNYTSRNRNTNPKPADGIITWRVIQSALSL